MGTFTFKIEYEAETLELFCSASPGGAFTFDVDSDGNVTSTIVAGGLDVAIDPVTGYYRHVLKKDSNGNPTEFGEYVYLDLTTVAGPFDKAIYIAPDQIKDGVIPKDLLSLGAFDFSETETDRNGKLYLTLYALLGLHDYAEKGTNADFKGALNANISAYEIEAVKKYLDEASAVSESAYMLEIVNFLTANKAGATDVATLEAILSAYAQDKTSDSAKAAVKGYAADLISQGNETKLMAFYAVGKDISANSYVKDYVDAKLKTAYFADLSAIPADVKTYLENYVDTGLRDMWGTDYDFWYSTYRINDLKAGINHGKGTDMTDAMRAYIEKMLTSETDKTALPAEVAAELTPEAYGCVLVDSELAAILQILMDTNTFAGVKNSWTKLCYYYEYYGPVAE